MTRFATIDAYIASVPPDVRAVLQKIRATIRRAVPGAEEAVSYNMPAFRRGRAIVYFAAFKTHIGLFPPVRDRALQSRIREFQGEKGNLQFPLGQPMPYALIADIARSLIALNPQRPATKRPARKTKKTRATPPKRKS